MYNGLTPQQYREAVEAAKDRILVNVVLMRAEYPHLFGGERKGLLNTEVLDEEQGQNNKRILGDHP